MSNMDIIKLISEWYKDYNYKKKMEKIERMRLQKIYN